MAGGWSSITDERGHYTGAGTMDTGGDVEEFAQDVFGMVNWLAAQLEEATAMDRAEWITRAERSSGQGMDIGGRADGERF